MSNRDIRLAPSVAVRVVGVLLVALGAGLVLATAIVVWRDASVGAVLVAGAVLLALLGLVGLLLVRTSVVRLTEQGYRVRLVRGVGLSRARWADVEDAVTTHVGGAPCVVLRLKDGRSTTIPVGVLAIDREEFVRVLQERLSKGRGYRPLT
ncbi:hypothetical protein [Actinosynnema sp.]|uniref:hypothetical protein n=1 Tax=Actinosynnema sp. TaxID=1872144 RepID=UPI003F87984A